MDTSIALTEMVEVRLDDPVAFRSFYEDAFPRVSGYLHRRCADRAAADDLTQETFLAAVEVARRGAEIDDPRAWIFGIARHKLVDHYRRNGRRRRAQQRMSGMTRESGSPPPGEPPDRTVHALAELPADQRAALVLHHADDLSVEEVARILGKSPSAVESLLVRGRRHFRECYGELIDV